MVDDKLQDVKMCMCLTRPSVVYSYGTFSSGMDVANMKTTDSNEHGQWLACWKGGLLVPVFLLLAC